MSKVLFIQGNAYTNDVCVSLEEGKIEELLKKDLECIECFFEEDGEFDAMVESLVKDGKYDTGFSDLYYKDGESPFGTRKVLIQYFAEDACDNFSHTYIVMP